MNLRRHFGLVQGILLAFLLNSTAHAGKLPSRISETGLAVIGDAGRTNTNSQMVRDSILRNGVKNSVLPGDNLYSGTYPKVWSPWSTAGINFDVVAIGNHNGGYAKEVAFFGMPSEYFTKVIDGAKFIVLNSDNNNTGAVQAKWLETELSAATEKIIFLVYHHPTYTVSKFHVWTEKSKFQTAIRPIIWKYRSKITALMVGHDHLASIIHFNDLPVFLSGAVQEVRSDKPVNNVQDGVTVQTSWYFDNNAYWAKLTWDSQLATAQFDYIRGKDDRVSCTAVVNTGYRAKLDSNCGLK
jgi:hypothetical protein